MIDIIYAILICLALYKGYKKGLIVAVFSFVGFVIGLAAALKLSVYVAGQLKGSINVSSKILPFISFAVVFLITVLLIYFGAKLIEKLFEMVALGWANKLGGILLYAILYTIIFSVFLFYAEKINFLTSSAIQSSLTYSFIKPWGPRAIDCFGEILPVFKGMFSSLENFFAAIPPKISS
ncbi:MAG TPA: CvpA family protein [Ferruginibacter sp.]|nr:CvpA family protein [Ferruginibacter sp.]